MRKIFDTIPIGFRQWVVHEKKTADAGEQAGDFPAVGIDFDALEAVNGDFRACYVTEDGSDAYMLPESAEQAEKYQEKAMAASLYRCREVLPEDAPVVTLSTCYGKAGGTQRFVVHGVQDKVKEY